MGLAVVIIAHLSSRSSSTLDKYVSRDSGLPAAFATDGQTLEADHIYIAPPDLHLLFDAGRIRLNSGPRINYSRPSIDVAMRSGAVHFGPRAVGILLSGMLDDGAAGVESIQACGGKTIIQDPEEAPYPAMPLSAINAITPDHVADVENIGALLLEIVEAFPAGPITVDVPQALQLEAALDRTLENAQSRLDQLGERTSLACPDCGGPLWEIPRDGENGYRCHIGHAYSASRLLESQWDEIEKSLWVALRSLEEKSRLLQRLAKEEASRRPNSPLTSFETKAREAEAHTQQLRTLLSKMVFEPGQESEPPVQSPEST